MEFEIEQGLEEICVPLVTGPVPENTEIVIRNADNGRVITSLVGPAGAQEWKWWQADLSKCRSKCSRLWLEVNDSGTGWGEWIAVGLPQIVSESEA